MNNTGLVRALWFVGIAIVLLSLILLCATVKAADELQIPGKLVTVSSDAVGWALSDLAQLQDLDRIHVRYLWIPPWGDDKWIPSLNFAVNTAVSHARTIQLSHISASGWLLRVDLRRLVPDEKQREITRAIWDGLAIQDPYFHIPATNTGLQAAVISPHLPQEQIVALAGLTLSTGAIYRADHFLVKALSTLRGGKYYDFIQIPRQPKDKQTPQDQWLASFGAFEEVTKNLGGDKRSAIFRSAVTGKPRRIDAFTGVIFGNLITITHDIGDEDVNANQDPIRNLLAFQDRAREIIIQKPNGLHAFGLTDANGNFQDFAPDNVVRDNTVPSPHTNRLEGAIACIRCHGPHIGYQPFGNDVQKLVTGNVDIFYDLGAGFSRELAIDRLTSLYAGQLDVPDGPIGRARRDYNATCYKLLGQIDPFTDETNDPAVNISAAVSQIYGSYTYDIVTPERACLELGLETTDGIAGLKYLLGELTPTSTVDPIVGALRAGIAVNRFQFESVYVDMALQAEARRRGKTVQEIRPVQKQVPVPVKPAPTTAKKKAA